MLNSRTSNNSATEIIVELLSAEKFDEFRMKMREFSEAIYPIDFTKTIIAEALERLGSKGNVAGVHLLIHEFGGDPSVAAVCYAHFHHTASLLALLEKVESEKLKMNWSMLAAEFAQQGNVDSVESLIKTKEVALESVERGYRQGGFSAHANAIAEKIKSQNAIKHTALKKAILKILFDKLYNDKHLHKISEDIDTIQLLSLLQVSDLVTQLIPPKSPTRRFHALINELNTAFRMVVHLISKHKITLETAIHYYLLKNAAENQLYFIDKNIDYLNQLAATLGLPATCVADILPVIGLEYAHIKALIDGQGMFVASGEPAELAVEDHRVVSTFENQSF